MQSERSEYHYASNTREETTLIHKHTALHTDIGFSIGHQIGLADIEELKNSTSNTVIDANTTKGYRYTTHAFCSRASKPTCKFNIATPLDGITLSQIYIKKHACRLHSLYTGHLENEQKNE